MFEGEIIPEKLREQNTVPNQDSGLYVCLECRYPLNGLGSTVCPECNRKFDPQDPATMIQYLKDPVRIFRCQSTLAAQVVSVLEDAGFAAMIQHMRTGMIGFVEGSDAYILVDRSDAAGAVQVLESEHEEGVELDAWECPECGEPNDAGFEICWNCEGSHPDL
ncbi:MAG: hypothetical protein EA377_02055 [Phycisphaerales bacterium]|nr:MAG: hypothetical protein EA377_02055 [Phycisphaerales bacterium]